VTGLSKGHFHYLRLNPQFILHNFQFKEKKIMNCLAKPTSHN